MCVPRRAERNSAYAVKQLIGAPVQTTVKLQSTYSENSIVISPIASEINFAQNKS